MESHRPIIIDLSKSLLIMPYRILVFAEKYHIKLFI